MKKKFIFKLFIIIVILLLAILAYFIFGSKNDFIKTQKIEAIILSNNDNKVTIKDKDNNIYTFNIENNKKLQVGSNIVIEYKGIVDKNTQEIDVINYKVVNKEDKISIQIDPSNKGIFRDYYTLANKKLKELSLDEKINQLLLVRYPENNQKEILEKNQFGGYIFFAKDFAEKTKEEVINMIDTLQKVSKIPILTAVDEEGGIVVRVSKNKNLRNNSFLSPRQLYLSGGMDKIREDTIEKSELLNELGINLNLAPVVDVSTNSNDYMYNRTIGEDTKITSEYAKTVISASKGKNVSYTLKHFPGYGNNIDTHKGSSIDNRTLEDIMNNDLPPFKAGIEEGAEAVLVSHNIVNSIDNVNPASLSLDIHNLLRNELKFTGVIITDDLAMNAISDVEEATVKAVLVGNDLIITTDYDTSFNAIKKAISEERINKDQIDKLAFRILAWKYYKGLI